MAKVNAKAIANGEKVELDFSDLSLAESMEFTLLESRIQRAAVLQMQIEQYSDKGEEPPRDVVAELVALTSPETLRDIFEGANRQMARVVKSVPRSWFVSTAPRILDMGDPATYGYLRADKGRELRQMILKAQQPEELAKN